MVVFESLAVGVVAIILTLAVVLVAVGLYVQIVWPLTDWDLVSVDFGPYRPLFDTTLLMIFAFGSVLGFWFISGAAWKGEAPRRRR